MTTQHTTNPGSKSPEEVQREVRQSRAEVEQTLDAIQDRLSPGQLFEQAVDYMRSSNGNEFVRNLGARVRDNPLPLVLVGTGLVWLMLSRTRSTRRGYFEDDDLLEEGDYDTGDYSTGSYSGRASNEYPTAGHFRDTSVGQDYRTGGRSYAERAKHSAEAARRQAEEWRSGGQAQDQGNGGEASPSEGEAERSWSTGLRESAQQWTSGARSAAAHAGQYGRRAQSGFAHMLQEQPLVVGAIGLAVGAAIGAALPKTEVEDEWMGDARDQLKDRARQMTREQLERARAAGRAAYEAAIEEADRQGWSAEGAMSAADAAAQKVERVAAAATEAARTEAQRERGAQAGSSASSEGYGGGQPGGGPHSQETGPTEPTTGTPRTEAERHGLVDTSSRIPSGT